MKHLLLFLCWSLVLGLSQDIKALGESKVSSGSNSKTTSGSNSKALVVWHQPLWQPFPSYQSDKVNFLNLSCQFYSCSGVQLRRRNRSRRAPLKTQGVSKSSATYGGGSLGVLVLLICCLVCYCRQRRQQHQQRQPALEIDYNHLDDVV